MRRKVILCLLLIGLVLLLYRQGYAQNESFEQQQVERMVREYGDVSYTAWMSVMRDVHNGLSANIMKLYDDTQFPFELALGFDDSEKDGIKKEVIGYLRSQNSGRQELLFHRVESWLLCWQQWHISTKLVSLEGTVAVVYEMKPELPMFRHVIQNRGFKKGEISGMELASSMSSAEIAGLEYELLNQWSVLSREDILEMFSHLLANVSH